MVLNCCDPVSAVARAENLRNTICGKPIAAGGSSLTISISVGVALTIDFPNRNVEEIIHEADLALYSAKGAGRNCVRVARPPEEKSAEGDSTRDGTTDTTLVRT